MKMTERRVAVSLVAAVMLVMAAGCKKKVPPPPPPPPPATTAAPTGKPVINFFNAEPSTINSGQSSSLRWSVTDATNVQIDGVGQVSPNGRRAVYPTETTTYHLTAGSAGGSADASATVTISAPPPAPVASAPPPTNAAEILANQVRDIHFGYDKNDIEGENQSILQSDAGYLKQIFAQDPNFIVQIEGHCDERGSAEYNIGLGDRRASATKEALVALGVPGDKLKTVSYGKERPLCTDANEDCYQRNRRAHFSAGQ